MGNCLACFKTSGPENTTININNLPNENSAALANPQVYGNVASTEDQSPETKNLLPNTTSLNERKSTHLTNNISKEAASYPDHNQDLILDNAFNKLFEEYKDDQEDAILTDGIEKLCSDLEFKPDDFSILVLAWRLNASQMFQFTRQEFIQGMASMNAISVQDIRLRLNQTIENLKTDAEMFKLLYRFTFKFGLEPGLRILSLDMAIILWRLVFTVHTPVILQRWLDFLEQPQHNIRGITKDTWYMFLNFAECDIMTYDDTEAWPSLFDDFVDYEKEKSNQKQSKLQKDDDNNNSS